MKKLLLIILLISTICSTSRPANLTVTGTTNIDDVRLASGAGADRNYGIATTYAISATGVGVVAIRVKNLSTLLPANTTILNLTLYLYCTTNTVDGYYQFYRILKPWREGQQNNATCADSGATSNDWNCTDNEWTTAFCQSAADSVDNDADGARPDRWATPCGDSVNVTTVNTWYAFVIDTSLANSWYRGDFAENGVLIQSSFSGYGNTFASSEYTTDATKVPYAVITFITPENRRNNLIRKIIR